MNESPVDGADDSTHSYGAMRLRSSRAAMRTVFGSRCPAAVSEFGFIQPRSPVLAKSVPVGDGWLHEPKLDSYRLAKHGRMVRLYSRRGHDWSKPLAALTEDLRAVPAHSGVVDA
jgi:ATP-dependent DNA ligase